MVEKGHKITNVLLILKVCDAIFLYDVKPDTP